MEVIIASCPCCGRSAKTLTDLLRHVRLFHFGTPGFRTLQCNLDGCMRSFKKYAVFRNHIYEYHSNKLHQGSETLTQGSLQLNADTTPTTVDSAIEANSIEEVASDIDMIHEEISEVTCPDSMQRASAIWILKTQEVNKLPQSTTERIMQDVNSLYEAALGNIHAEVQDACRNEDIARKLSWIFSREMKQGLFRGLETHYQQLQYYKDHLSFVVSLNPTCKISHHASQSLAQRNHNKLYWGEQDK